MTGSRRRAARSSIRCRASARSDSAFGTSTRATRTRRSTTRGQSTGSFSSPASILGGDLRGSVRRPARLVGSHRTSCFDSDSAAPAVCDHADGTPPTTGALDLGAQYFADEGFARSSSAPRGSQRRASSCRSTTPAGGRASGARGPRCRVAPQFAQLPKDARVRAGRRHRHASRRRRRARVPSRRRALVAWIGISARGLRRKRPAGSGPTFGAGLRDGEAADRLRADSSRDVGARGRDKPTFLSLRTSSDARTAGIARCAVALIAACHRSSAQPCDAARAGARHDAVRRLARGSRSMQRSTVPVWRDLRLAWRTTRRSRRRSCRAAASSCSATTASSPTSRVEVFSWWKYAKDTQRAAQPGGRVQGTRARRRAVAFLERRTLPDADWAYYEKMRDYQESGVVQSIDDGGRSFRRQTRRRTTDTRWQLAQRTYPTVAGGARSSTSRWRSGRSSTGRGGTRSSSTTFSSARPTSETTRIAPAVRDLCVIGANHILSMVDAFATFRLQVADARTADGAHSCARASQ